jgi:signal transduction histidine kinase/ActR/RegA family two-component response regulator
MFSAIRRSLKAQIVAIVFIATLAALIVSSTVLLFYEIRNFHDFVDNDLMTQAQILARSNAPALQFSNDADAAANLALLASRDAFEAAAIYTLDGEIMATYSRGPAPEAWPSIGRLGETQVEDGSMTLFHDVVESDNRLGTIYLRARYDLTSRVVGYAMILVSVMFVSLVVAALVTISMTGRAMMPLHSVTRTAKRVIEERDFSLRAEKTSNDEIGLLVDAFNAMLTEVGDRATRLEDANLSLHGETEIRRRAEAELRVADRRKDEFLATLAHELRNPLAPLVSSIELMQAPTTDRDGARRHLAVIERQVRQLVHLVDDLLDVSRITTGKLKIHPAAVDLEMVVQDAVETIEPQLRARSQSLAVDLPDDGVYVLADASRLTQIIDNLLHNAVKFSPAGSGISLSAMASDTSVCITVTDRGVGISDDTLSGIFEMFTQGQTIAEYAPSGLGVGLALVKQLVALHGGSIEASSDGPGKGATFTLTMPRAKKSDTAPPPATRAAAAGVPARVLVVDDNEDFALGLAQLLETRGHDVRVAHNADDALLAATEFGPEIGFLDIGLPRVDGYELARRLRELPLGSGMMLVAVSGWGQEEDRRRSREAGFVRHLVKPVRFDAIQSIVVDFRAEHPA